MEEGVTTVGTGTRTGRLWSALGQSFALKGAPLTKRIKDALNAGQSQATVGAKIRFKQDAEGELTAILEMTEPSVRIAPEEFKLSWVQGELGLFDDEQP